MLLRIPNAASDKALPTGQVVRDWAELAVGERVEVVSEMAPIMQARVDAVSNDGSIVWLVTEGTGGRSLHLTSDPLTLYLLGS